MLLQQIQQVNPNKKAEAIRGKILCTEIEVRLSAAEVRQPGWTRMESAIRAMERIGLEVEECQRIQVFPVKDGEVLVRFFDFGPAGSNTRQRRRVATF